MCDVGRFFATLTPAAEEEVAWLGGTIRLRLRVYLTDELAPLDYVSSVRAVVVTDAGCAVLRNADGVHALPGGRREPDETLQETLCRELREEIGCRVTTSQPFGLLHFHHLTGKPSVYPYPYPDFLQVVFAVRGTPDEPSGTPDPYETSVEFVALSRLGSIELPAYQRLLVRSALLLLGCPSLETPG
jgi:8-oxo-dGTP pyrophosphatase MutT (NUDIX family)